MPSVPVVLSIVSVRKPGPALCGSPFLELENDRK